MKVYNIPPFSNSLLFLKIIHIVMLSYESLTVRYTDGVLQDIRKSV